MPTEPAPADSPKMVLGGCEGGVDCGWGGNLHFGWVSAECFDILLDPLQGKSVLSVKLVRVANDAHL
jgi:hypothetical protein